MKIFVLIFMLSYSPIIYGQDINIKYENRGRDIYLYVDNPYNCPVSFNLQLDLSNMISDLGSNTKLFILQPKTKNILLTKLSSKNPRRNGNYRTNHKAVFGDVTVSDSDIDRIFELPYKSGTYQYVHQGYNGKYSHQGVNAIDFNMKSGTPIYASRGGYIIKIEDRNSRGCPSPQCHKYNNYIVIYHTDGSLGVYSHLQKNGVKVNVGDFVQTGQFIGLSGGTGYTTGPHLHFMVMAPRFGENKTIKTKFNTLHHGVTFLKEKVTYTKP